MSQRHADTIALTLREAMPLNLSGEPDYGTERFEFWRWEVRYFAERLAEQDRNFDHDRFIDLAMAAAHDTEFNP